MLVKVYSKTGEPVHPWNYEDFKEIHKAKNKAHKTKGS